jgi:hypothetical protein
MFSFIMQTKATLLRVSILVTAALCFSLSSAQASVQSIQQPNGATTTKVKVIGQFVATFLIDSYLTPMGL